MGLFNRKNPYEKDALDLETAMTTPPQRPELPSRQAPQPPQAMPMAATPHTPPPPQAAAPRPTYGIEDAIRLMRELPDNKKEMVITIVQKTLLSAKINVSTIIDDAARKIDRLEKKNEKLSHEIRELEEAILQRKMEMEKNAGDIHETREVKMSFESAQPRTLDDYSSTPAPYIPAQRAS